MNVRSTVGSLLLMMLSFDDDDNIRNMYPSIPTTDRRIPLPSDGSNPSPKKGERKKEREKKRGDYPHEEEEKGIVR